MAAEAAAYRTFSVRSQNYVLAGEIHGKAPLKCGSHLWGRIIPAKVRKTDLNVWKMPCEAVRSQAKMVDVIHGLPEATTNCGAGTAVRAA